MTSLSTHILPQGEYDGYGDTLVCALRPDAEPERRSCITLSRTLLLGKSFQGAEVEPREILSCTSTQGGTRFFRPDTGRMTDGSDDTFQKATARGLTTALWGTVAYGSVDWIDDKNDEALKLLDGMSRLARGSAQTQPISDELSECFATNAVADLYTKINRSRTAFPEQCQYALSGAVHGNTRTAQGIQIWTMAGLKATPGRILLTRHVGNPTDGRLIGSHGRIVDLTKLDTMTGMDADDPEASAVFWTDMPLQGDIAGPLDALWENLVPKIPPTMFSDGMTDDLLVHLPHLVVLSNQVAEKALEETSALNHEMRSGNSR